ncbi:MAG: phosphatidate cytidylyltransferase [Rhodanobacter sp.]
MTAQGKFWAVMAGVLALLLLASAIGWWLARRAPSNRRDVIDNLNARIRAWWWMAGLLCICFVFGHVTTLVFFAFASFFALREFTTLTPTRPGDHLPLVLCFYLAIPLQYWLIGVDWYGLFAICIPVYGFLLLPAITALKGDTENFLERTTKIQWGLMLTVYCVSYAPAVLFLHIPGYQGQSLLLMLYLLLVVQISDVLQYVFGKLFGKHKLAPNVSPSKTVEGLVGGGLCATLVGACLWWITPFSFWGSAGMSLVIVLAGFMGGLALSAVKRSIGAKDWGDMIEGHGGILDRLDSVIFAAPIFFHIVHYAYV